LLPEQTNSTPFWQWPTVQNAKMTPNFFYFRKNDRFDALVRYLFRR
jgi:hypothetical protein